MKSKEKLLSFSHLKDTAVSEVSIVGT